MQVHCTVLCTYVHSTVVCTSDTYDGVDTSYLVYWYSGRCTIRIIQKKKVRIDSLNYLIYYYVRTVHMMWVLQPVSNKSVTEIWPELLIQRNMTTWSLHKYGTDDEFIYHWGIMGGYRETTRTKATGAGAGDDIFWVGIRGRYFGIFVEHTSAPRSKFETGILSSSDKLSTGGSLETDPNPRWQVAIRHRTIHRVRYEIPTQIWQVAIRHQTIHPASSPTRTPYTNRFAPKGYAPKTRSTKTTVR